MTNNKLIFIVAGSFSLLTNIPRLIFLFGGEGEALNTILQISVPDTIFRVLAMFFFCFVVLKFNLKWSRRINLKYRTIVSILMNIIAVVLWIQFFKLVNLFIYNTNEYTVAPKLNSFSYVFVMVMLLVISKAINLNNQSKLDAIEKEKLKQQSLQNELTALKNQVNPHFLFNSLNSLSLLVREDQKAAGKFINKLSFLYRYILQGKGQDLVTIKEELKFLESYVYLIKERYRDNFNANINVNEHCFQKKIPTMALQLLVENAVKHNEISNDKPLQVDVFDTDDMLIVKNKLQKRTGHIESTNTGLINLNTRFKLQMNRAIEILKDDTYFTVKLPLV